MSDGLGDKIQGAANRIGGKVQEEVGEATGNADTQAQGEARQVEGKGQQVKGDVENTAENVKKDIGHAWNDATN